MRCLATLLCAAGCSAGTVPLATFDGAEGTTHRWAEQNDPVMGGRSTGTTTVAGGALVFDGVVAIVPSLKAPGFIKTSTTGSAPFPDVRGCEAISLTMRSAEAFAGYRFSFGDAHPPAGKFFARGYKANFAAPVGQFGTVVIPLRNFTDYWDDATGEAIKTCAEDEKYCPDDATLRDVKTMSVWGEGVAGKVHLEVKSISATGCPAAPAAAAAAGDLPLVTFDGAEGTTYKWSTLLDPVMGGESNGTVSIKDGAAVFDAYCAIVPKLQAPGFVTIQTDGTQKFADASAYSALRFSARSTTPGYKGFKVSFAASALSDTYACATGKPQGGGGCFKAPFSATREWSDIVIPFASFTDQWNPATGLPTGATPPTAKNLADIQRLAFWGEGVAGKLQLEVRRIAAASAAPTARVAAGAVPLVTFDGAAGTTHAFSEVNDPVMGGKSNGTWHVDQAGGFGVFDGEVVDVPSLSAPGFIKTVGGVGGYADASSAVGGDLVLSVRTTTPEYAGFRASFASGALLPSFSCAGGGNLPGSGGCYKAKFAVKAGAAFSDVRIPFASFSDKWSSATGEQTTTCAQDKAVCPTAAALGKLQDVEIWAEGALGKVHLEVKSISAAPR